MGKRGVGLPELLVILGLLLVFTAGMMEKTAHSATEGTKYLAVKRIGELKSFSGYYRHIKLADKLILGKGIEGVPLFIQKEPVEVIHGFITLREHVFEFTIPPELYSNLRQVSLKLFIEKTNKLGALQIYLNGKKIWEGVAEEGLLEIPVPINLLTTSKNVIKITCTSSGWRLWAPTQYRISYIEITELMDVVSKKKMYFSLLPSELDKIYMFRLYAKNVNVKVPGELAIIFNDHSVVYRGIPTSGSFLISFTGVPKLNNSIEFNLVSNGHMEFKGLEVIVLSHVNASSTSFSFSISPDSLQKVQQGKCHVFLEFPVIESGNGPLEVVLTSHTETTLLREVALPGTIKIEIPPEKLSTANTLTFRSFSRYVIGDAIVKLVCQK